MKIGPKFIFVIQGYLKNELVKRTPAPTPLSPLSPQLSSTLRYISHSSILLSGCPGLSRTHTAHVHAHMAHTQ